MMETCEQCKTTSIVYTEYHSRVCTRCGLEDFARILDTEHSYGAYAVPLISEATYTRVKRFKKYLMRAAMEQSANTIPEATWNYLLGGQPYNGPASIVRRLKKKTVRKKCYDSLPFLVKMLCPHIQVPTLSERDKSNAVRVFQTLDTAYRKGEPFVSYLYALEYILELIGCEDLLPFINKISCRNRRAQYRHRLDRVFKNSPHIPV